MQCGVYESLVSTIKTRCAEGSTLPCPPLPALLMTDPIVIYRNLDVKLELGGLPWTCLQGEPTGLNWCNAAGKAGDAVYKQPPSAWLSANGRGEHTDSVTVDCRGEGALRPWCQDVMRWIKRGGKL